MSDGALDEICYQIDHVDHHADEGWSVLVKGTLLRVDPDTAEFRLSYDPLPWITDERHRWLVIEPFSVTDRRLHTAPAARAIPRLFFR